MRPKPSNNSPPLFPALLDKGRDAARAALARAAAWAVPLVAVDATCGNGHDTCFLADCLSRYSQGNAYTVFSFDVQASALKTARRLAEKEGVADKVVFLQRGHEFFAEVLDKLLRTPAGEPSNETAPALAVVLYNLGFLPRSDKQVTTQKDTTLASLSAAAKHLAPGGLLAIHAYGGHPGGLEELEAVDAWCAGLPFDHWNVVRYSVCNKPRNPEALFLAEKRVAGL